MTRSRIAKPDARNRELAAIHVGKRALNLDDDTYRAMLWTCGRVRSSKDLDAAGRQKVIDHMRARGFERRDGPRQIDRPELGKKPIVTEDRQGLVNKIEALLAAGGYSWNYARKTAERMFKLQLDWCWPDQLQRLVAALEYDKRRRAKRSAT